MATIDSFNTRYDAVTTTVATGQTNRDMKANNATLFLNVTEARFLRIVTDQTISIRFNSTDMPAIVMTATESPRKFTRIEEGLAISNIFISNASGSTANVKMELYS
jgi:hypothetical protein